MQTTTDTAAEVEDITYSQQENMLAKNCCQPSGRSRVCRGLINAGIAQMIRRESVNKP